MSRATRWWVELLANLGDAVSLPLVVLLTLGLAVAVGLLWYFWPAWLPKRNPFGRRKRRSRGKPVPDDAPDDRDDESGESSAAEPSDAEELPDLPVTAFLSLADRLAAERRYAEAVRERLRAIVRDLIDHEVVEHSPGWTVTELARAAAAARPAVNEPVRDAGTIFSDIWYGMVPATRGHDDRMRLLAAAVHDVLGADPPDRAGPDRGMPGRDVPGSDVPGSDVSGRDELRHWAPTGSAPNETPATSGGRQP